MEFLRNIKQKIKALFGKQVQESRIESNTETFWERDYTRIDAINFTEIFANRLTNYAIADSTVDIDDENISELLQTTFGRAYKWVQMALGIGRVFLVPYVNGGKVYTDIIPQSRAWVTRIVGGDIIGMVVLADIRNVDTRIYQRWTLYEYDPVGKSFTITNKATTYGGAGEISLATLPEWEDIPPQAKINGVERPLFAYCDSPKDNRTADLLQGASITMGCEDTIKEIRETLKEYASEFELKRAFVGVDKLMIDKETGKPSPLFITFEDKRSESLFEVFSPDIRDQAYRDRINALFARLEKQVGTSSGILTPAETANATATQVRRSMFDTFCMVSKMRRSIENCLRGLCECYAVYLRLLGVPVKDGLTPSFDWDNSFVEDTAETFAQLTQGQAMGAISEAEVRRFIFPSETEEEAEEAVRKISENKPEQLYMPPDGLFGDTGADGENERV